MAVPFFSWPRERKLVFLAMAACVCTSVLTLCGYFASIPPVLCALPLLVAATIYLEYPPPGKGCGLPAAPLPGLTFLAHEAAAGLGTGGSFQKGHAYAVIFVRADKRCHQALARVESIWQRCRAQKRLHVLLVSLASPEELSAFSKVALGSIKSGRGAKFLTVPLACDAEGEATRRLMRAHGAFAVPHAFVIGVDGVILWHGHTNRTNFVSALSQVISQITPHAEGKEEGKEEGKADGKVERKEGAAEGKAEGKADGKAD
ncbi:hypothetical protein AB1Y20_023591 [Prymnesium parvum]|uniref:Thioredoxin-like fold domain-containing protein n=1 Tax=Prymnesium parvum TaxID=97485 RepID=A0AB34JHI9_PRYPA